ncbi:MAG: hypothetical protein ACT4R6_12375 [Gemmatimonadaceae bacterium]
MNDKQIAALARKNAARSIKEAAAKQRTYDATLDATRPPATTDDLETARLFNEMKKREF